MKNDCKNAIRHLVCKTYEKFAKYKDSVSVLSLPGESWEFENYILNHQDFRNCIQQQSLDLQLVCFEKSFRTYSVNNLLDRNKDNNTKYLNEKLNLGHLNLLKNKSKFLWFDFCGNPSVECLKFVQNSFNNNEKVCAIFTFTLGWRVRDNLPIELDQMAKDSSNEEAIKSYFKECVREINLNALSKDLNSLKTSLLWEYTYISSRAPMICLCVTNDPALRYESSLKGQGELQKQDQESTLASKIKGDLGAGEELVIKMQANKRSLAAHKAWVTIRANKAKAALAAAQTVPENI
jgi:hypothetical protein